MSPDRQYPERLQLIEGMVRSGLSYEELWWLQVCVGGDATAFELEAYLLGLLRLDPHQHDVIAQALNEHFLDRGQDHPVAYSELADSDLFDPPSG